MKINKANELLIFVIFVITSMTLQARHFGLKRFNPRTLLPVKGKTLTLQGGIGTLIQSEKNPTELLTKKRRKREGGWYMRTRVAGIAPNGTVYEHNSAGVFGELIDSRKKKDRHDIPAFGPAVLQVVFPHYNWGENDSGDYWSDYRKYRKRARNRRKVWTFLIRNQKTVNLSNAEIKIKLDDARKLKYVKENGNIRYIEAGIDTKMKNELTLVDVDNHRTYSVDELPYADFTMEGKHTRTFRWVKGRVTKRDFKPVRFPH